MNKKRIIAVVAAVMLFASAVPAASSRNSGIAASLKKDIAAVLVSLQRKVMRSVNRIVRMYEASPYSSRNFKKATDEIGDASRIKE